MNHIYYTYLDCLHLISYSKLVRDAALVEKKCLFCSKSFWSQISEKICCYILFKIYLFYLTGVLKRTYEYLFLKFGLLKISFFKKVLHDWACIFCSFPNIWCKKWHGKYQHLVPSYTVNSYLYSYWFHCEPFSA